MELTSGAPTAGAARRLPSAWWVGGVLGLLCLGAAGVGAVAIGPAEALAILGKRLGLVDAAVDPAHEAVLLGIRLPRVFLGAMQGALLACSGALLQGLFRNPLADPGLLGTSGGAMLAAAAWTVLGAPLLPGAGWALGLAAFAGALCATALVLALGSRAGGESSALLLLAGIAVNAIAFAGTSLFLFVADDAQLRSITFWSLGSLGGASWHLAAAVLAPVALLGLAMPWLAPRLDALLLGAREAGHLGIRVGRLQLQLVVATALAVGTSVAASGSIGFVGLVVPNLVRLAVGPSHRALLPLSAAGGAGLVVVADALARVVVAPVELPIGVVTSLLGAPFFLHLIGRRRSV